MLIMPWGLESKHYTMINDNQLHHNDITILTKVLIT